MTLRFMVWGQIQIGRLAEIASLGGAMLSVERMAMYRSELGDEMCSFFF